MIGRVTRQDVNVNPELNELCKTSIFECMCLDGASFTSPVGMVTAAISVKHRLAILRYHRQSTNTPVTVDRNISAGVSRVSTDSLLTQTTC